MNSDIAEVHAKLSLREKWVNKIDFLLACVGFSVGLGNVWRFPYLCYANGGGAFLIPYFTSVIIGGIPLFFLEVALGQYMQQGGIEAWNIVPLLKGIGYASTVVVFFLNCYYNIILTWAIYYLYSSFNSVLPWSTCDNSWNTVNCSKVNETGKIDSVSEFWEYNALRLSDGIEDVGSIVGHLAICLLVAWIIVYLCICKGIKTSGKVMYFTATSPYAFMLCLLVRAATLPGAASGLYYYLVPNFSKIWEPKVWADAGTQIFFSYSISLGTLTALGSYNDLHHNSFRDCLIFAGINSGTSFFAGFVIFMTLGYMSHQTSIPINEVASSGPGLAFIAYPKALAEMPGAPVWSVLFFIMIILLGLDSQFVGVEGFVTAITDLFPVFMARKYHRELFILLVCIISYFIGLSMVTGGGMYVFQIFDYYTGSRIILIIALMECLAISYVYGADRFRGNLKWMYGIDFKLFPAIGWGFICPIFCLSIFFLSIFSYSNLSYTRNTKGYTYTFPTWSVVLGWSMASSSVAMIPIVMVYQILKEEGPILKRLQNLLRSKNEPREIMDIYESCQLTDLKLHQDEESKTNI